MSEVVNTRLYLPAEEGEDVGERKVMHPETNAHNVLVDEDGTRLSDILGANIHISQESEGAPKGPCLWLAIQDDESKRPYYSDLVYTPVRDTTEYSWAKIDSTNDDARLVESGTRIVGVNLNLEVYISQTMLPPFSAVTVNGKDITNEYSRGAVVEVKLDYLTLEYNLIKIYGMKLNSGVTPYISIVVKKNLV